MDKKSLLRDLCISIKKCYELTNNIKLVEKFLTEPMAVTAQSEYNIKIFGSLTHTFYQALLGINISDRSTVGSLTETEHYFILRLPAFNASANYYLDKISFEVVDEDYSEILNKLIPSKENIIDFLGSDEGLDLLNEVIKSFPEIDIAGPGSFINEIKKSNI